MHFVSNVGGWEMTRLKTAVTHTTTHSLSPSLTLPPSLSISHTHTHTPQCTQWNLPSQRTIAVIHLIAISHPRGTASPRKGRFLPPPWQLATVLTSLNPGSISCPSWMMEHGLAKRWFSTGEAKKGARLSRSPHPTPTFLVTLAFSPDGLHLSWTWRKKVGPRGVSECLCPELERRFWQDFQATSKFLTGFGRSQTIRWLHFVISPWGGWGCATARSLVKCCFGWNQGLFSIPRPQGGWKEHQNCSFWASLNCQQSQSSFKMATTPSLPGLLSPQGLSAGRGTLRPWRQRAPFLSCSKPMQTGRPGSEANQLS